VKLTQIDIAGAWLMEPDFITDGRGSFARVFCEEEFSRRGLETHFPQHSISRNLRRGTLRGLHFQTPPHAETKLVACPRGAIFDVCVDLRPDSPTYCRWAAVELSAENGRRFLIPKGCAHGFQTLTDDAEVHYFISTPYEATASSGVRYDDPAFGVDWPLPVGVIADKDRGWPDFAR
jgi:dTDP-4-dehydrorhamnose 3,5-epimerase